MKKKKLKIIGKKDFEKIVYITYFYLILENCCQNSTSITFNI